MAGYVAMTRVQGGHVRVLAWNGVAVMETADLAASTPGVAGVLEHDPAPTLRERWTWFREELAMMTFFLLDPESWR